MQVAATWPPKTHPRPFCLLPPAGNGSASRGNFIKSGLPRFAQAGLEAAHGEGCGPVGVAKTGEVEDAVEDVGEEFVAEAEAVPRAQLGGDGGANDNFPVGEGEDIGGGGVAEVTVVKPAAFPGGDEDNAQFPGQAAQAGGG